jgi:hypothetical protein
MNDCTFQLTSLFDMLGAFVLYRGFDVSKQLVGGVVVHTLNLAMSYISGYPLDDNGPSNPCVW